MDREVDRRVRVFVALFEPCLLIVMAVIVGFIVISMLLPVFTLSGVVK
jgi:type II secretory pathway component PulF